MNQILTDSFTTSSSLVRKDLIVLVVMVILEVVVIACCEIWTVWRVNKLVPAEGCVEMLRCSGGVWAGIVMIQHISSGKHPCRLLWISRRNFRSVSNMHLLGSLEAERRWQNFFSVKNFVHKILQEEEFVVCRRGVVFI